MTILLIVSGMLLIVSSICVLVCAVVTARGIRTYQKRHVDAVRVDPHRIEKSQYTYVQGMEYPDHDIIDKHCSQRISHIVDVHDRRILPTTTHDRKHDAT